MFTFYDVIIDVKLSQAPSCTVEVACPKYLGLRLEWVNGNVMVDKHKTQTSQPITTHAAPEISLQPIQATEGCFWDDARQTS